MTRWIPFIALFCTSVTLAMEIEIKGLEKPAEIVVDQYGVPHIYAGTHYDAFFVQGFNAARDRLWQIDMWRRRGLGQLSEVLGPAYVEQDMATRMFLYRGSMFHEWLAYGSDAKEIATRFTAGINAYIDWLGNDPERLPVEFRILDYQPERWQASDVVRIRSHGLWRNVSSEVTRARFVCDYGLDADAKRRKLEPAWTTEIPDGLDPCEIPKDVLKLYYLAKLPVDYTEAVQFKTSNAESTTLDTRIAAFRQMRIDAGSNNWAVAPSRTTSGRAILANDPHRGHAVPSLRYIAHLVAPGLNVIGAGEPALPGISIGHNEQIAFGLTIFSIDQEDLLVYRTRDDRYWYEGEWVPFDTVTEVIPVRDAGPVPVDMQFTRHGPVVFREGDRAFAVRAAWLEPGMAPYFGSVEYMRATNWREFLAALNRWGAPAENQVFADIEGNIGYKPAGLTPIRPDYDGLMPVPGDGRFEWSGFYDMDALPVSYNPSRGWVGTANAMSLPEDYDYQRVKPGFEWSAPWRFDRIAEVLDEQDEHSFIDSVALQRDYLSTEARRVLSAVDKSTLPEPAKALFEDWDYRLTTDSAAAALFEVWVSKHLRRAVLAAITGAPASWFWYPDSHAVVTALETVDNLDGVVRETIVAAIDTTQTLLGDDPEAWRWGDLHKMHFQHPLAKLVHDAEWKQMSIPVVSRGGSGATPNATSYRDDFMVASGGSWRMVLDVGNWDRAVMTNAPGQSGDPSSPHYSDLVSSWGEDGALPLLFDEDVIRRNARSVIRLLPGEE